MYVIRESESFFEIFAFSLFSIFFFLIFLLSSFLKITCLNQNLYTKLKDFCKLHFKEIFLQTFLLSLSSLFFVSVKIFTEDVIINWNGKCTYNKIHEHFTEFTLIIWYKHK